MSRRTLRLLLLGLAVAGPMACRAGRDAGDDVKETSMNNDAIQILQTSDDAAEMVQAAVTLAREGQPDDHDALFGLLRSPEFLARLDDEEDYEEMAVQLRVGRVLDAFSENRTPSARKVLVKLTQEQPFLDHSRRVEALIAACANLRPPGPRVVAFWARYAKPEDPLATFAVAATVTNGDAEALDLMEKCMTHPGFDADTKIAWMQMCIFSSRNDLPLLQSCGRLLGGGLPVDLRDDLVEVLFATSSEEWFPTMPSVPAAPNRAEASVQSREQLRTIGEMALKTIDLNPQQKADVEAVLATLRPPESPESPDQPEQ